VVVQLSRLDDGAVALVMRAVGAIATLATGNRKIREDLMGEPTQPPTHTGRRSDSRLRMVRWRR
jgi:hypothetical protein